MVLGCQTCPIVLVANRVRLLRMDEFDSEQLAQMDKDWLLANGWTIEGNLAYRRILKEFKETGVLQLERIEQILMQYGADHTQFAKIIVSLKDLIELKQIFS